MREIPDGLSVYTWKELNRSQFQSFNTTRTLLLFIMLLIVFVVSRARRFDGEKVASRSTAGRAGQAGQAVRVSPSSWERLSRGKIEHTQV